MTRGQAPVLDPSLEPDELFRLIDDIAEVVERYRPTPDPEPYEDQVSMWRSMYDELVGLLRGNGIPLDLS